MRAGKRNVLGILVDAIDYDGAVDAVIEAARQRRPFIVTALAVHGLMEGYLDQEQRYRLNRFDLVVPDGQPVRWALNWLYGAALRDRVYGPNLTLAVCRRSAEEGLSIFLYGSTPHILSRMQKNLTRQFPRLVIAGAMCSRFRRLDADEKRDVAASIRESGASLAFVGLGCPRQEVWAFEFRNQLSVPILAVGAAFPFIGGLLPQAPRAMQDYGLEWLFRLWTEPRRLWKRYLLLNPAYVFLLLLQALKILHPSSTGKEPTQELLYG
jgi:N-acetylglucosaminyldiphosphoundecaprenol N-acetyl-beta-D-mannosaminyltransferase